MGNLGNAVELGLIEEILSANFARTKGATRGKETKSLALV